MGLLKLFVDTTKKQLVQSFTNAGVFSIPKLIYGDKVSIELQLVEANPTGTTASPFNLVDTAPYSLKVAIGLRGGVPYSIQDTWTKTTGAGAKFSGYLDLGQTNMGTAMGSSSQINGFFEIELNSLAGGFETQIQQEVTIYNQVIAGASEAPMPEDEYFTKVEAAALFVGFANAAGLTIKLRSPNNLWELEIGQNDDGSILMESTAIPP